MNGVCYVLRTGCSWRNMPHDLPNGKTVYYYFRKWKQDGTWERAMTALRKEARKKLKREEEPSAAIIDSQSIKTSGVRGKEKGYDGGKKIWGRKRHVLVDTQGFLLAVKVHAANISDKEGAKLLVAGKKSVFPRVEKLFGDHGYRGEVGLWIKEHVGWNLEVVAKEGKTAVERWLWLRNRAVRAEKEEKGFAVKRKRWIVERTLAWLIRYRRLARDYEGLPESSEAFIQIATIRLLLNRLVSWRSYGRWA